MSIAIPVIDCDARSVLDDLRRACETFGFFYVSRAPVHSYDPVFEESNKFFEMSEDFKKATACNAGNLGYTSFQDETLAPHLQKGGDTKEGYYIGREPEGQDDLVYPNVWPDEEALPEWKEVMKRYHAECTQYCERIVRLLAKALNLSVGNDLDRFIIQKPTAKVRLLKYGRIISNPDEGVMGAGPHSDYGMMTLLATNDVPGLEILVNDQWHPVEPRQDMYIVNLGDCLQRMTNNQFRSTVHRVLINTADRDRYSIAFFYEPNRNAVVQVLPEFVSAERPAAYAPQTYGEYLDKKFEATHKDYKKASVYGQK